MINLTHFSRRVTNPVRIGNTIIGGNNPIAVQSMTNTPTANVEASVAQVISIANSGAPIVRLTAQGKAEGEALKDIVAAVRAKGYDTAIVADIHFVPAIATIAAQSVDKVRINPGNYRHNNGELEDLISLCKKRGVALRIGVNHGSLARHIVDTMGDTPEGMVESAMEFLRICKAENFDQVVVSIKSSNTRVMVYAYRLLVEAMDRGNMHYPLHIGLTEAGNEIEGRIKSAVAIGALLADGIGDTIRVSLTEKPENEVPVAKYLVAHFADRGGEFVVAQPQKYIYTSYSRRSGINGAYIHTEVTHDMKIYSATSKNPTAEWRANILGSEGIAIIRRRYEQTNLTDLAVAAAADMGQLLLDGLADGIWIDAPQFSEEQITKIELLILQAARVRISATEYIACPSCGRTLYDIESTLAQIKARTSHLKGIKIGVMGCIVNGPGEMADADYGYVGAGVGKITLYKAGKIVEKNIPQEQAIDHLIALIKSSGDWK